MDILNFQSIKFKYFMKIASCIIFGVYIANMIMYEDKNIEPKHHL